MGLKIHEYPNESLIFGLNDFYDIDFWNGSDYETKKIKGSTIQLGIESLINTLYSSDGTISEKRIITVDNEPVIWNGITSALKFFLETTNPALAKNFGFRVNELERFVISVEGAEPGLNAGSNFSIKRYDDAGAYLGDVFVVNRATGTITLNGAYSLPVTGGAVGDILTIVAPGVTNFSPPETYFEEIDSTSAIVSSSTSYISLLSIVPAAGRYMVSASISLNTSNSASQATIGLAFNTVVNPITERIIQGTQPQVIHTQKIITFNGTDTLELYGKVNSNSGNYKNRSLILIKLSI